MTRAGTPRRRPATWTPDARTGTIVTVRDGDVEGPDGTCPPGEKGVVGHVSDRATTADPDQDRARAGDARDDDGRAGEAWSGNPWTGNQWSTAGRG